MVHESRAAEIIVRKALKQYDKVNGKVFTISIDGPTACGKTIAANRVKQLLEDEEFNVIIFQLDWALVGRPQRVEELATFRETSSEFPFEAELHMRLNLLSEFLEEVGRYKSGADLHYKIELKELYDRNMDGLEVGSKSLRLSQKTIIIIEGHYGLRSEFLSAIDLNVILMADVSELIQRKVERVAKYRNAQDAIDYFHFVDLPSIKKHINNFWQNVDLAIENTDYLQPYELIIQDLPNYYKNSTHVEDLKCFSALSRNILSQSKLVSQHDYNYLIKFFDFLYKIDAQYRHRLTQSIYGVNQDMRSFISNLIVEGNLTTVQILDLANIKNVYSRQFPCTVLTKITLPMSHANLTAIMTFHKSETKIQVYYLGQLKLITLDRVIEYSNYTSDDKFIVELLCPHDEVGITVFTPTDFISLPLQHQFSNIDVKLTGKEEERFDIGDLIYKLVSRRDTILIHRFPMHRTARQIERTLNSCGITTTKYGNYLIAINEGKLLSKNTKIKSFINKVCNRSCSIEDETMADDLTSKERTEALTFMNDNTFKTIRLFDGEIVSNTSVFSYNFKDLIKEVINCLNSKNRQVRKIATQYLAKTFPELRLKCSNMWTDLDVSPESEISVPDLVKISPSIMSEVFMWIALRGEPSAILAANIYDIRKKHSFDAYSHLTSAILRKSPLIIQTSMNAIGHTEGKFGGYLKLKDTPADYIDSVMNCARQIYLDHLKIPFFGLGIDHLNSASDHPNGRSKRFSKMLFDSRRITYLVLDAESLFSEAYETSKDLELAYLKMIKYMHELIVDNIENYLIDKEICISELNYLGKKAWIPEVHEVSQFIDTYQKFNRTQNAGYINTRPHLFIGNVGTMHHAGDMDEGINTNIAKDWVDAGLSRNFISAVLHGTTSTTRNHLISATNGCYKVNVAGEFLKEIIDAFPGEIRDIFGSFNPNSKRLMPLVSKHLENLSTDALTESYQKITKYTDTLMSDLNSPIFTNEDFNYFHYSQYIYDQKEILEIEKQLLLIPQSFPKSTVSFIRPPTFAPSLIEVPTGGAFEEIASALIDTGAKYFHIDIGDGIFIPRQLSAIDKVKYLKRKSRKIKIGGHFMVRDPHSTLSSSKNTYLNDYIEAGCDIIGLHRNSFTDKTELENAMQYVLDRGLEVGLIIEVEEEFDEHAKALIDKFNISWIVCMGVPIGYGGQMFDRTILSKVTRIKQYSIDQKLDIRLEVDGGLTFDNIRYCKYAGADTYAGWSLIKGENLAEIMQNYAALKLHIAGDENG